MPKKAFVHKIAFFVAFVIAVILLIFMIKFKWDVPAAVNALLSFVK